MKKKKRHSKRLLMFLLVLALLGGTYYGVTSGSSDEEESYIYKETTVEFGDLVQGIMESGTVELQATTQDYEVVIEDDDDEDDDEEDDDTKYLKVEEVYVSQGQRIREGDPILKLTDRSINAVRRILRADEADAEITLEDLMNQYEVEEVSARQTRDESLLDAQYADAQYTVSAAEAAAKVQELQTSISVLENEIKQIEIDLENSWEDYDDLRKDYEKYKRRYEEWDPENLYTYVPLRTTYLSYKEKYESETKSRLDQRQDMVDKQDEINKIRENIEILQQRLGRDTFDAAQEYDAAVATGEEAENVYSYALKGLEEEIRLAKKEVEDYNKTLEEFDSFVGSDGVVYAKGSGLITEVAYEEGDSLKEESAIITYVEEDCYVVSIDISEEDIPYVSVGDGVTIVFTAYPEDTYSGTIKEITTTETSDSTATVSYPVIVQIQGDTDGLYGGMTADVTFVTDQVSQVTYVSRKAITTKEGKSFVYVKSGSGNMITKEVETGFTDGVSVQIVRGLESGDTVYIASKISTDQSQEMLMETGKEEESDEEQTTVDETK